MTLAADIESDLGIFYDVVGGFAVSVLYTPLTGTAKTIAAIVSANPGDEFRGADAYGQVKSIRIQSHATLGVTLPVHGDAMTIGAVGYEVQGAVELNDGLEWDLTVSKT
jgi:hypothetical protein